MAEEICSAGSHIKSLEIPSLTQMLAEECSVYPFQGAFEEVKNNVAFIAHSSGTTGNILQLDNLKNWRLLISCRVS